MFDSQSIQIQNFDVGADSGSGAYDALAAVPEPATAVGFAAGAVLLAYCHLARRNRA